MALEFKRGQWIGVNIDLKNPDDPHVVIAPASGRPDISVVGRLHPQNITEDLRQLVDGEVTLLCMIGEVNRSEDAH